MILFLNYCNLCKNRNAVCKKKSSTTGEIISTNKPENVFACCNSISTFFCLFLVVESVVKKFTLASYRGQALSDYLILCKRIRSFPHIIFYDYFDFFLYFRHSCSEIKKNLILVHNQMRPAQCYEFTFFRHRLMYK